MSLFLYLIWIILNIVFFAVISVIQYPIRKKKLIPVRIILIPVKLLLASTITYLIMVLDFGYIFWISYALGAVYIVLFGDMFGDILTLPVIINGKYGKTARLQLVISALCVSAYLAFGTINMQTVTAKEHLIYSDKLHNSYKIVFITDMHVGSSQSLAITKNTIRQAASEQPDIILLGGDIVDEYTTKDEMEQTFSFFGTLDVPVYFVYGNHDRQDNASLTGGAAFTPEELETALLSNGIHILKDEWVRFSDDLTIFGRESYNVPDRKSLDDISVRPENTFILQVDHSPYLTEEIEQSKADLQLSGHSHAAQLFPLNTLYRLAGYDSYGFFRYGETELYVTAGASGWIIPFRSEKGCHYEVFYLSAQT